jgi:hypothetical protein
MIIQDAHRVEARLRRKCGLEAGSRTENNSNHPQGGGENEEGDCLLGKVENCEREIDIELENQKDELDETNERKGEIEL